jgi:hypothetical protein
MSRPIDPTCPHGVAVAQGQGQRGATGLAPLQEAVRQPRTPGKWQRRILLTLEGHVLTMRQLSIRCGAHTQDTYSAVRHTARQLVRAGQLIQDQFGRYGLSRPAAHEEGAQRIVAAGEGGVRIALDATEGHDVAACLAALDEGADPVVERRAARLDDGLRRNEEVTHGPTD